MSDTRECDVAIIGAGTAGLHAYKAAVANGADVVIIERGSRGSTCTATGCIPSKLLIAAGNAAHAARHASTFGVSAGPVSIDGPAVMNRVRRHRDRMDASVRDNLLDVPEDRRIHGEARFTGADTLQVGDVTVRAGAIIIAAGARPQVPDMLDPVAGLVHTHETIFEIDEPPQTLAVVGAGPLGLELAQAFARLGTTVVVLDKSTAVASLSDPDAEACARQLLSADMAIHLGVDITATMTDGKARLTWTGDSEGSVTVDMVLAATGRAPDLDALDLAAAGIALDDKGVPRFDHLTRRCGDSRIWVAGDIDGWRPVLHEAARGGRIAGTLAAGGTVERQIPALAIAFTEPNIVEVGTAFDDLPDDALVATAHDDDIARTTIENAHGVVRLYGDRDAKLLGGTIVLARGEHLGQILALAIDDGLDATRFADEAWYHPVFEELLQSAARDLCAQAGRPSPTGSRP